MFSLQSYREPESYADGNAEGDGRGCEYGFSSPAEAGVDITGEDLAHCVCQRNAGHEQHQDADSDSIDIKAKSSDNEQMRQESGDGASEDCEEKSVATGYLGAEHETEADRRAA